MSDSTTGGSVLLKHMLSSARDAQLDYLIDWPTKRITLTTDFIPASLIESFLAGSVRQNFGIVAYDEDLDGPVPRRTDWIVDLIVGAQRYRVKLIRQITVGSGAQWATEFHPYPDDASANRNGRV